MVVDKERAKRFQRVMKVQVSDIIEYETGVIPDITVTQTSDGFSFYGEILSHGLAFRVDVSLREWSVVAHAR